MQGKYLLFLVLFWFSNAICAEELVFTWPGNITVPFREPFYVPAGTSVRIELSEDENIQRELRIREGVIVTLDCTRKVNATIEILREEGLPLSRLRPITWYGRFIDPQGEFISDERIIVETATGAIKYNITGVYNELLEADGSLVPAAAKQGGTGTYRCELCFNGTDNRLSCNSSRVFNNVIGDPPFVIRGDPDGPVERSFDAVEAVFGTNFCISRRDITTQNSFFSHSLKCSHNTSFGPANPEPVAMYLRNGQPVDFSQRIYSISDDGSLTGKSNTLNIDADYARNDQFNAVLGNYTCILGNLFGRSVVMTTITECCLPGEFPQIVNASGFIENPLENTLPIGGDTCLAANLRIQCPLNTTLRNSTTIAWTRNNVRIDESDSMGTVTVNSVGTYTCCATNRCGTNCASSVVFSRPIIDTGMGVLIDDTIKVGQNSCLQRSPGSIVSITCQAAPFATFSWTSASNPSIVLSRSSLLTVATTGTYQCTARNACGISTAQSTISRFLDVVIDGSVLGIGNGCGRLKTPPSGVMLCPFVGESLSLMCSVNGSSVTPVLTPPGSGSSLTISPVTSDSTSSVYTCQASNFCGTSNASTTVAVFDPARINLTSILPPSTSMKVVVGAGRTSTAVGVGAGRTVELHCPYSGIETPQTFWFRLIGSTPVLVRNSDPGVTLSDDMNNLVLTIASYSTSFAGTYFCNTSNNAGDDIGNVTLEDRSIVDVIWRPSPWRNCSKSCGGGERTRDVLCVSRVDMTPVDIGLCDIALMPHSFEYCNTEPCCDKDLHSFCKLIPGTGRCSKPEFKETCCCTCKYYE